MAPGGQLRPENDDPFFRPVHSEGSVYHQLPGADGRFPAGHAAYDRAVSDLPASVRGGHRRDGREIGRQRARCRGSRLRACGVRTASCGPVSPLPVTSLYSYPPLFPLFDRPGGIRPLGRSH